MLHKKLNIFVTSIINHGSMIKSRQKSSCIVRKRESGSLNKWNMHGEPSIIKEGLWPTSSKLPRCPTTKTSFPRINMISKPSTRSSILYFLENKEVKLPPITSPTKLVESFSEFFDGKIAKIMHHLHETIDDDPDRYMYKEETFQTEMRLKKFSHVFYTDIKELVATTPNKSCKLDLYLQLC